MKVRELIEQLEKLDRDTDIWVYYDRIALLSPEIDVVEPNDPCGREGDYYFHAW